jgi:hypothetical protein
MCLSYTGLGTEIELSTILPSLQPIFSFKHDYVTTGAEAASCATHRASENLATVRSVVTRAKRVGEWGNHQVQNYLTDHRNCTR